MKLYAIPNCDKVKKARAWLEKKKIAYDFHDYKKEGVDAGKLKTWAAKVGWENLLNTKGTTWRQLPDSVKDSITSESAAIKLMIEKPSVIKRPLIEQGANIRLGFDEEAYKKWFL